MKKVGIDRIMWGSDYPHNESTFPHNRDHLRRSFAEWDEADLRKIFAENASKVYRIDMDALIPLAERIGPSVDEVATPLETVPKGAFSPAFTRP